MAIKLNRNREALAGPEAGEKAAGVYVHIPFCLSKCPYCDFNSYPIAATNTHEYTAALLKQVELFAGHSWVLSRSFASLYIGGGTPTVLESGQLAGLIACCSRAFRFAGLPGSGPEVTVECNPNTVDLEKLIALKQAGANRISIGVQSFSDKLLRVLGRSHSAADGLRAFALARDAGFANISIDLMYGLPQQELKDWVETLDIALALAPEHFSLYELTLEQETPFYLLAEQNRLGQPDEETVLAMMAATQERLGNSGLQRYEISNFSRPGFECRHNINYWENGSYLGLGAGAVSCFSGLRIKNSLDPGEIIRSAETGRLPFFEGECLSVEDRCKESVVMGLRMTGGVDTRRLGERFDIDVKNYYGRKLENLVGQGLLEFDNDGLMLRLTEKGLLLANQVMAELI